MKDKKVMQVWSNGGGMQSAAIAALIITGKLPPPDLAGIVDTGRERGTTWSYLESVIAPALAEIGVKMHRIPRSYSTVDIINGQNKNLMPMYSTHGGKLSKLPTFCSTAWKRFPFWRWLREQGVNRCEQWLGISIDESDRRGETQRKWVTNRYPLIELGLTRRNCKAIVKDMGWPEPPKSRCWMCPHQTGAEWTELLSNSPAEFQKAVDLEEHLQILDPHVYFHKEAKPLNKISLAIDSNEILDVCKMQSCWT